MFYSWTLKFRKVERGSTFNPLQREDNYSARSNNMKLVHWPLMGGLFGTARMGLQAGPFPQFTAEYNEIY